MWDPGGGEPLQYLEGREVTVFSWVDFSPQYVVLSTRSEKLTKPSDVFQMLALKVFS